MLMEESPEVHNEVLPKIVALLETSEVPFNICDELIHALLHALKISMNRETRLLIGNCIGKIGAIDPGKIGVAAVGDNTKIVDRRPVPLKFVDDLSDFFEEILEFCAKLLIECADASKVDFFAMTTQLILKELCSPDLDLVKESLEKNLKEETKHEIEPYKTSRFKFNLKDKPISSLQPYAEHSRRYDEWLWKWYFAASDKIRDCRLGRIFIAFQHIYYSDDYRIVQLMLPQVVLQGLIENNTSIINEACAEIFGVFKKSLSSDGWIRLAAQTCFQMIEIIEKFEVSRSMKTFGRTKNDERDRVQSFLKKVVGELREGTGELLCVAVAEKYNFACRALLWLEQYGIKVAQSGKVEFNRAAMYALERIYLQLGDTDGVLGAYETIQNHITASPQERVVAFEATGDHTEALPLYQQKPVQKVALVKCLLRLNQPLIAYNLAGSFAKEEEDEKIKYKLRDYQIEAAYRREEWQNLDEILKDTNEKSNQISSWGAHVASIFAGIHNKSKDVFIKRIKDARMQLMDSLKAVTMEGADTYSQAYRYIQRLHILYEIEDGAQSMKLFNPPVIQNCDKLVEKWDARSANAIQCSSILEPIYWVRRELLRFADPEKNKDKISHYLIESCKFSRHANHLSTSWAHLIHARSLGVEKDLEIDMEEARYFFQRGQKGEAICSLQKTLEKNFPQLVHKLKRCPKEKVSDAGKVAKDAADGAKLSFNQRKDFVKTQLLLTDFMEKSSASNITDIYLQYAFMSGLAENDENHAYSLALFYDNAYYSRNMEDSENVTTCLKLYARVLHLGRRYLLHVMPRMLTVWLDFAAVMHEKAQKPPAAKKGKKMVPAPLSHDSQKISDFMRAQFRDHRISKYFWFTAFPQLISRLCHPDQNVFKALEEVIADLLILYPHECLWQAIASYRADPQTDHLRYERTRQIFRTATGKTTSSELTVLIKNYNTFAGLLIELAEDGADDRGAPIGFFEDFNRKFHKFKDFFKNSNVKISIPFITMVEKKMPNFLASQISLPSNDDSTIYITGIEDKYKVFGSMEKPKLITMIGSNGVKYQMIAKKGDELRKDARVLDFCRMVNTLLLRDSEARRRQLHIRTYSVIPLQARGGLIEVVSNLIHLRVPFASTTNESETTRRWNQIKGDKAKRRKFFDECVEKNPVKMAEYLRLVN
uniref:non-specific serine/threonine protein kinase n=1 Tax=Panagrolaimus superbus TaxID=310955 RepID=A0A914YR99_9BILA